MQARSLSAQIMRLSFLFVAVMLLVGGGLAWWAENHIDGVAMQKQVRAVSMGLSEAVDSIPVEQDSSAIWDEAVLAVRANDDAWIAENLAEWMSEYYGHEFIYLLDPQNNPVRAVASGTRIADAAYEDNRRVIEPLAIALRAAFEAGEEDLPGVEWMTLADGQVGAVSIRPIVPGTETVAQAPQDAFLHVSVKLLDAEMLQSIAYKFDVEELKFDQVSAAGLSDGPSVPVINGSGRTIGLLTWKPYRPAAQMLVRTAPVLAVVFLLTALGVAMLIGRLRRISDKLQVSEAQATYLAFHDPLTKVPNRALFEDRISRAIATRRLSGGNLAIHAIDVDRFKQVNDTLGHPVGDELIRQVAQRLGRIVREVDTVARIGGDEFTILQPGIIHVDDALKLSQRIVRTLGEPFELNGHLVDVSASVGVAFSEQKDEQVEDLLRHADIALYEAKTSGRGRYQLFAGDLNDQVHERRKLELELRAALQGEPGLFVEFQPIFDARSGTVAGAEALIRWRNARRGLIPPDAFIPLAEERGLIDTLGLWVLREACTVASHCDIPWIAVNVSPNQFRDERFAGRVAEVVRSTGLAANRLELEVTEGLLLQNSPTIQEALRQIRASGTRVALDDFGTGYSSISYLRSHGVDKLKIDQSFVDQLGQDLEIDDIVRCIVDLANAMHMKVTAEGVETETQMRLLKQMGCDQLQGYLLSRPVSAAALQTLVAQGRQQRALSA